MIKQNIFEKTLKVYFEHTDMAGVLFFSRVFDLAHACLEDYVASQNIGWDFWFKNNDFKVKLGPIIENDIRKYHVTYRFRFLQEKPAYLRLSFFVFLEKSELKI